MARGVDRLREVTSKKIPEFLVYSDSDSFDKEPGWKSEPSEWVGRKCSCESQNPRPGES